MTNNEMQPTKNFILYTTPNGEVKLEVFIQDETLWLTQKAIAALLGVEVPAISKHLKNIFMSGELEENSVVSILETTASDGKNYNTAYYNLDAIISVGYRVNSSKATQFRIWATQVLKEYIIKGFAMNDARLKQGDKAFGKDYFRELLERVRSIRTSERRIYQQITDIFAECSIDYDPNSEITHLFYATVQNKFHYAITKHTAAEIIFDKANNSQPLMGLSTWQTRVYKAINAMENNSQIIIYQTENGETKLDVRLENETVWLTQKLMAELFQTTPQNITIHLKNIFEEGELSEPSTCKDFLQVRQEGGRTVERIQKYYNLDAIISVGYRIKSSVATRFRQWATQEK